MRIFKVLRPARGSLSTSIWFQPFPWRAERGSPTTLSSGTSSSGTLASRIPRGRSRRCSRTIRSRSPEAVSWPWSVPAAGANRRWLPFWSGFTRRTRVKSPSTASTLSNLTQSGSGVKPLGTSTRNLCCSPPPCWKISAMGGQVQRILRFEVFFTQRIFLYEHILKLGLRGRQSGQRSRFHPELP